VGDYTFTGFYGMAYQHSRALMGRYCLLKTRSREWLGLWVYTHTHTHARFAHFSSVHLVLCPVPRAAKGRAKHCPS